MYVVVVVIGIVGDMGEEKFSYYNYLTPGTGSCIRSKDPEYHPAIRHPLFPVAQVQISG